SSPHPRGTPATGGPMTQRPDRLFVARPPVPVLEVLDEGVCVLDAEWRITYWNPAAERLLAIPREAALGAVLWERLPRLQDTDTRRQLDAVRDDGVARRFMERFPREEGPEWV